MTWEELREMAEYKDENNMTLFNIESHSHTHLPLPSKDEMGKWKEAVLFELQTSQNLIKKEIGKIPRFLAFPGADYWVAGDEDFIELAKESGYFGLRMWLGNTVDFMSSDIYQMSSFPVLNKTAVPVPISVCRDVYAKYINRKLCEEIIEIYDFSYAQLYNLRKIWKDFHKDD